MFKTGGRPNLRGGWLLLSSVMSNSVASSAHRYQVLFAIIAGVAAKNARTVTVNLLAKNEDE